MLPINLHKRVLLINVINLFLENTECSKHSENCCIPLSPSSGFLIRLSSHCSVNSMMGIFMLNSMKTASLTQTMNKKES